MRRHSCRIARLGRLVVVAAMLFTADNTVFGQNNNIRERTFAGAHIQIFGPGALGLAFDYHLSPMIDLDVGLGLLGQQIGARYHPFGSEKNQLASAMYCGAYVEWIQSPGSATTSGIYIPFGIEFISGQGLSFTIEAGYNYTKENFGQINTQSLLYAFRFGYHFVSRGR